MRNRDAQRFRFVGFYRCLDFINTAPTRGAERAELIRNFADLVSWLHEAALLGTAEARNAMGRWDGTSEGDHARARAIAFRARLQEMAEDMAASNPVSNAAIAAINEELRTRSGYVEIFRREGGLAERFRHKPRRATQLIAPVAESAASLLCEGTPSHVRRCANPDCRLFFYDTSKTHRRRWCDMRVCGQPYEGAGVPPAPARSSGSRAVFARLTFFLAHCSIATGGRPRFIRRHLSSL